MRGRALVAPWYVVAMSRSWGLHAIVLLAVLAASAAAVTWDGGDRKVLIVAFFWMPLALVYTAVSTAMVALLRPGRAMVALAHVIALALAIFAPLLFVKTG